MRKLYNKRRSISLILIIIMGIIVFPKNVYANKETNNFSTVNNNIISIEKDLEKSNTTVVKELEESISYYRELLKNDNLTNDEIIRINTLINNLKEQIVDYKNYKLGISFRGTDDPVLSAAVSSVIAWFNNRGYRLSAELLTHAKNNDVRNSLYIPVNGGRVTYSSVYKTIAKSSANYGSSSFPKSGTEIEVDLYYAIHGFDWTKDTYGKITITDLYDFAPGQYKGIQGIAVDTMYMAQQKGVIVPFGIKITK